jgi:hypothetical protein
MREADGVDLGAQLALRYQVKLPVVRDMRDRSIQRVLLGVIA